MRKFDQPVPSFVPCPSQQRNQKLEAGNAACCLGLDKASLGILLWPLGPELLHTGLLLSRSRGLKNLDRALHSPSKHVAKIVVHIVPNKSVHFMGTRTAVFPRLHPLLSCPSALHGQPVAHRNTARASRALLIKRSACKLGNLLEAVHVLEVLGSEMRGPRERAGGAKKHLTGAMPNSIMPRNGLPGGKPQSFAQTNSRALLSETRSPVQGLDGVQGLTPGSGHLLRRLFQVLALPQRLQAFAAVWQVLPTSRPLALLRLPLGVEWELNLDMRAADVSRCCCSSY